jgi:hypothetical protein
MEPIRRGATMVGNQTNKTGGGPLEQVEEALGGVFGGRKSLTIFRIILSPPFSIYCKKH